MTNRSLSRQRFTEAAHRFFVDRQIAGLARKSMLRTPPVADILDQSAIHLCRRSLYRDGRLDCEAVRRSVGHFSESPSRAQQNCGGSELNAEFCHEWFLSGGATTLIGSSALQP